jgi:hypothetical protein
VETGAGGAISEAPGGLICVSTCGGVEADCDVATTAEDDAAREFEAAEEEEEASEEENGGEVLCGPFSSFSSPAGPPWDRVR